MDSVKGALKSKTVWFNVITGVLEIANLFATVLPPGTMTAINVIGNVALRFVTSKPLSEK
jgi:hypothetical protein